MPYVPTTGTGSALSAQMRAQLKNGLIQWLIDNGQTGKGMIGETGIPGSSNPGADENYDPGFTYTMYEYLREANAANLHVTLWAASEWNLDLRPYRNADGSNKPFSYRTTVSSAFEPYLPGLPTTTMWGVNLAGADFSDSGPNGGLNAGTLYGQYYYPQAADWTALAGRGVKVVRFPVRWERMQPTLKQPLDATQMGYITTAISQANAAGIKILLDVHNYGRYDTTPTGAGTGGVYDLGQNAPATHNGSTVGGTMISCFVDFWSRVATALHGTAGLWSYGLCNEPHDLTGNVGTWQEACRQAVEAIRLIDQAAHINVGGYNYSGIGPWYANNGSTAWLTEIIPSGQAGAGSARNTDPLIIWEGHMYFDYDGTYSGSGSSFSSLNSSATGSGYAAYSNTGTSNAVPTLDFSSQTGVRTTFGSTMDSIGDWTYPVGGGVASFQGSNTVTLPYAGLGNPGNSLQVIATATSDEGSVRRTLTAPNVARTLSFDFYIPTAQTLDTSNNFAIFHGWDQNYVSGSGLDTIEIRIVGSGSGYKVCLTNPTGTYTTVIGTTVLNKGVWNNIKLVMSDTGFSTFLNGFGSSDVTLSGSYTGKSIGGIALGKFYGTSYVGPMYFDNFVAATPANYDAPPNGGLLTVVTPPPATVKRGLLGFF